MASGKPFFSYSRTDLEFVSKLANDLRTEGVDFWIDRLDIPAGERWDDEVEKALISAETIIVVLSPASVYSENVKNEFGYALDNGKRVIPILLEKCRIPMRLARLQRIDFGDDYGSAFEVLLASLGHKKTTKSAKLRELKRKPQKEKDKETKAKQLNRVRVLVPKGKILTNDFIKGNKRIKIISNNGKPVQIPQNWKPILSGCDLLVIIPDMHTHIYNSNLDNFKYGAKAMLDFLNHLNTLKEEMAVENKILRVYQIGDLFERRFPGLHSAYASVEEIRMSHPDYNQIINMMNELDTHFIYGNHDFELRHLPGYRFASLEGKVYIEHGFTPDSWDDFSNPDQPLWEPGKLLFLTVRELNEFFARILIDPKFIKKDEHYSWGIPSGDDPNYEYPSEKKYLKDYGHCFKYFKQRMQKNPENKETKICVVGHTHHPYLNKDVKGNKFIYVDAGAWTEGRSDFVVITDEELAICCYERE
jgi:UDP-2,3-diacylglucosamine pyrophosphatase LpxH